MTYYVYMPRKCISSRKKKMSITVAIDSEPIGIILLQRIDCKNMTI